jgi:uncharacterized membrane protein YciS (DUF1049 family)
MIQFIVGLAIGLVVGAIYSVWIKQRLKSVEAEVVKLRARM